MISRTKRPTYLLLSVLFMWCWWLSDGKQNSDNADILQELEFNWIEPANELGIYTKVIAQIYRTANQTTEEWRLNREYLPYDAYRFFMSSCKTYPKDGPWKGCISDDKALVAYASWGIAEPKNKTITYLELQFKPFTKTNEKGEEKMCILEEVYKERAFIVLKTFSDIPSNSTFPRDPIESVAAVHQHQLDSFGENFLSIFEEKIDLYAVYNFGEDEYYDRDPPYECFLNIGSSESVPVIEEKCDFFCLDMEDVPREEMEKILIRAKEEALAQEKRKGYSEKPHDEL